MSRTCAHSHVGAFNGDKSTMPYKALGRRISAAATAGGFLALALAPASSNAAVIPFGSDLAAPANLVEARQADTAYWQTTFADGRSPVVQADGQIRSVQIKGIALANPVEGVPGGETMFHVQVMAPRADGTFQIRNPGGTSGAFYLPPRLADPQAITTYQPENLCARAGDVVSSTRSAAGTASATRPVHIRAAPRCRSSPACRAPWCRSSCPRT